MHGLQSQLSYTPLWLLALAQTFALFTDTYNLQTQTNEKVQNVFTHFIFMFMKMRHRHAHPVYSAHRRAPMHSTTTTTGTETRRARAKSKAVDTDFSGLRASSPGSDSDWGYGQDTTHVDTSARRWRVESGIEKTHDQ